MKICTNFVPPVCPWRKQRPIFYGLEWMLLTTWRWFRNRNMHMTLQCTVGRQHWIGPLQSYSLHVQERELMRKTYLEHFPLLNQKVCYYTKLLKEMPIIAAFLSAKRLVKLLVGTVRSWRYRRMTIVAVWRRNISILPSLCDDIRRLLCTTCTCSA